MEPLAASFFQHAIHGRPYGSMDNVHAKLTCPHFMYQWL